MVSSSQRLKSLLRLFLLFIKVLKQILRWTLIHIKRFHKVRVTIFMSLHYLIGFIYLLYQWYLETSVINTASSNLSIRLSLNPKMTLRLFARFSNFWSFLNIMVRVNFIYRSFSHKPRSLLLVSFPQEVSQFDCWFSKEDGVWVRLQWGKGGFRIENIGKLKLLWLVLTKFVFTRRCISGTASISVWV